MGRFFSRQLNYPSYECVGIASETTFVRRLYLKSLGVFGMGQCQFGIFSNLSDIFGLDIIISKPVGISNLF